MKKNILYMIIAAGVALGLCGCGILFERKDENIMTGESKAILDFLNCDYELFESKGNEAKIIARFNELVVQGQTDGFYPLIIEPSDTLADILGFFVDNNDGGSTPEAIAARRQEVIEAASEIDAEECLSTRLNEYMEDYGDYDILGQFLPPELLEESSLSVLTYRSSGEIIIAKIPAKNPWELAAWIPMGGFNDCPFPAEQVAVFRYWHEKYGAIPAYVTYDIWQVTLTKPPVTEEEAEALAKEQFAFCSDIVTQGAETIRGLASTLKNSAAWYFWWD